jgi:hypothetical protein
MDAKWRCSGLPPSEADYLEVVIKEELSDFADTAGVPSADIHPGLDALQTLITALIRLEEPSARAEADLETLEEIRGEISFDLAAAAWRATQQPKRESAELGCVDTAQASRPTPVHSSTVDVNESTIGNWFEAESPPDSSSTTALSFRFAQFSAPFIVSVGSFFLAEFRT